VGPVLLKVCMKRAACARQVFDVELHAVHNCRRRQVAMFSDVVCDK
jgi:hypothetical protein